MPPIRVDEMLLVLGVDIARSSPWRRHREARRPRYGEANLPRWSCRRAARQGNLPFVTSEFFFFLPIMSRAKLSVHDARSLHCRYPAVLRRGSLEPMWTSPSCLHPQYMRPYCHCRADEALSTDHHP